MAGQGFRRLYDTAGTRAIATFRNVRVKVVDFMIQRESDNFIVNTDKMAPFSILDVAHLLFIFFLN
jgi:hypothetical protein